MKVIFIISGLMFGGGQRVVLDLLNQAHHKKGSNARLILLGCCVSALESKADEVIPYDGHYNRIRTLLGTARRLRQVLQNEQPDILHTHGWDADIIGWLAIQKTKIWQIAHLHITADWLLSKNITHQIKRGLTNWAFRRSRTQLVAVSDAVRRHWTEWLPSNGTEIHVIRNGIDVNRYHPLEAPFRRSEGPPVIGIAARLAPMKGIEYLLDALGMLARESVSFQLKVAGEGGYRSVLEDRVRQQGIADRITFLGHVENMPEFYRGLDVYALPSISTEGLPLGVLEAMASALPVLATTVAGTPEAVRDGLDGLLVPPRNTAVLADKLRLLLGDADLRQRLGTSARQRAVEAFSLQRFSDEVFDLYRRIQAVSNQP